MVGDLIDELYTLRSERIALEKKAEAIKATEMRLQKQIHEELVAQSLDKKSGHKANFSFKMEVHPQVVDWPQYYAFMQEKAAWGLLQKRVSTAAWKEYLDTGIVVPGSVAVNVAKYSITKR